MSLVLEKHIGVPESDEFSAKVFGHVLNNTFETLLKPINKEILDEKILIEVVHYMEDTLEKPMGKSNFKFKILPLDGYYLNVS